MLASLGTVEQQRATPCLGGCHYSSIGGGYKGKITHANICNLPRSTIALSIFGTPPMLDHYFAHTHPWQLV